MTHPRKSEKLNPNHYKCVVVGDGGVGKTSMLIRYVQGDFLTEYSPTYFDSFNVTLAIGDEWTPCSMTLVDTAGQETYDRLRALTYFDTDVFIVCFSVVCPDSFINVRSRWLPELKEFKPKIPVVLVGTQTDLRDKHISDSSFSSSSSTEQQTTFVSQKEGKRLANKMNARLYAECSALTGEGLDNIFYQALLTAAFPKRKNKLWRSLKRIFANG